MFRPAPSATFNAMWIRWSAYQIAEILNGRYIMPTPEATAIPYSSTESLQELLTDAVNLGKAVYQKSDELERECLSFVQKHGLLGLHKGAGSRMFPMKGGNVSPARKDHSS